LKNKNSEKEIDVSIVIVNYNVKDFLHQCLTSIEKAKHNLSLEVFVVDNDSTDGSMDFLEPLFRNSDTIKYFFIRSKENLGFAKANNIAIKQAKGKYLLILNPDTILAEDTLNEMINYMEQNPEVGISGCKVLNADGSFQLQCRRGFPTPWTSFCKLFGLQKIFPNSKLFAKYNQTFRPVDETYYIDAVIGAFMFCDTKLIQEIGGFDETYFMYGEDLDLCRQVQLKGRFVAYFHKTTIIHFKGESTRRSSINEIKHSYQAMEKFASKYFANSKLFILFLKLGIFSHSILARIAKNILPIFLILSDLFFINVALLIGSYAKFGRFFGFPDYAYPIVFIAISAVYFICQFFNGEYFEKRISVSNTVLSLMMSFFILSSITYFLPSFRFSRGAIIVMIGLTTILSVLMRIIITVLERTFGKHSDRKIIIAGCDEKVARMIEAIQQSESQKLQIIGIVSTASCHSELVSESPDSKKEILKQVQYDDKNKHEVNFQKENLRVIKNTNYQHLGNINNISTIANKNKADEVIITDTNLSTATIMKYMANSNNKIKYHLIPEYDELVTSRIINDISDSATAHYKYNLNKPRFKFIKRFLDIISSTVVLTVGFPFLLFCANRNTKIKKWFDVFIGNKTVIGIYEINDSNLDSAKIGLIGLVHINKSSELSAISISKLNEYYLKNYSISLDIEILIKYFFLIRD